MVLVILRITFKSLIMKRLCTALLLLTGMFINAQTFGATALSVNGTFDASSSVVGQWLRQGNSDRVIIRFAQTPNGINEAMTLVDGMLLENGMSFTDPDIYRSVEGKDILNNNRNPDILHNSIQKGNSKINLAWNAKDGSVLQLFLGKNGYEVTVMGAYK